MENNSNQKQLLEPFIDPKSDHNFETAKVPQIAEQFSDIPNYD